MSWLLVFIPNILWPFITRFIWQHRISFVEVFSQVGVISLVIFASIEGAKWSGLQDVEVWNGFVTGKKQERVSCEHSYSCNCRQSCSGSGTNRSCSTICDTCYDHPYDYDWRVYTNIGSWNISRIDRRGSKEPPRWTKVAKDDPVSDTRLYSNYVLAAPHSLFNFENSLVEKYQGSIPAYPRNVYDYYHVDRVINLGVSGIDGKKWSAVLQERLSKLGSRKKVNAVIVLTTRTSPEFADAIRASWKGGKKNDVILVVSIGQTEEVLWSRVFSWSKKELFKIQLQDQVMGQGKFNMANTLDMLFEHINNGYVIMDMAEYEYLKKEMKPSTGALIGILIFSFLLNGLMTYFFHRNDVRPMSVKEWKRKFM